MSNVLRRVANRVGRLSVALPGGMTVAKRLRRRSLPILMYHGVVERPLPFFNWCQVPREDFEQQIAFLSQEYRILPLQDVLERLSQGSPLPERTACITFDDGFRSVLSAAYPVLAKYSAAATTFLVTSLVGGNEPPWPEQLYRGIAGSQRGSLDFHGQSFILQSGEEKAAAFQRLFAALMALPTERREVAVAEILKDLGPPADDYAEALAMLNWKEVETLHAAGLMSFGSHTHRHPILSKCSPERQHFELFTSRQIMIEHFGKADVFAYPNGTLADFTRYTKQLLAKLGYRWALSTIRGLNTSRTDSYELRRVGVGAAMTFPEFQTAMMGF